MKKFLSILMVIALILSLGVSAFAANTNAHVITITNASAAEHTYEAYQVFSGDFVDDKLSNIEWGSGVNGEALLAELVKDDLYKDCKTAEDVANVLSGESFTTAQAEAFADVVGKHLSTTVAGTSTAAKAETGYSYSIPVTGDGYYFIKDQDGSVTAEGDSYTDYILQVVGDVNVAAKSSTIVVKKEVATGGYACNNTEEGHVHSIAACGLAYADSSTAQIGDVVSYKISATVPAEASKYDYYFFIFGDTLTEGLTFDPNSVSVTIGGEAAVIDTDYTVSTNYGEYTFAIALIDAKANAGKEVVATYEAKVNEEAVIGLGGNSNEVTVEFSRDPSKDYGGKTIPDGFPAEGGVNPDGETPKDITKTYVTEINILKVDGKDNTKKLEGAVFAVSGTTESSVVRTKDVYTESDNGGYWMLKGGSYTTSAPVAESMQSQTDRTKGGYVVCEASDPAVKYTINGTSYRVATADDIADESVALYVHIASNEALYESTTQKYTKETQTVYECTPEEFSFQGTTDENGELVITGLNAGTYTITEIVAPSGYNLLKEPVVVNVSCELPETITTGNETCNWSYNIGNELTDGTVQITIENNSGAELPSTGGIGTTIFYVCGSILLVGAAVVLITKKRMSTEG